MKINYDKNLNLFEADFRKSIFAGINIDLNVWDLVYFKRFIPDVLMDHTQFLILDDED